MTFALDHVLGLEGAWPEGLPREARGLVELSAPQVDEILQSTGLGEADAERIKALRSQTIEAVKAQRQTSGTLASFRAVREALQGTTSANRLVALRGRWVVVVLDEKRRRVPVPWSDGTVRYLKAVTRGFPTWGDIPRVPEQGAVLVIYGGGPEIFDMPDVQRKARALLEEKPSSVQHTDGVADLICCDRSQTPAGVATLRWHTCHGNDCRGEVADERGEIRCYGEPAPQAVLFADAWQGRRSA